MNEVWILRASQGQWSDHSEWTVDVYATAQDAIIGNPELKLQEKIYEDQISYEYVLQADYVENYDDIYYDLTRWDVVRKTN